MRGLWRVSCEWNDGVDEGCMHDLSGHLVQISLFGMQVPEDVQQVRRHSSSCGVLSCLPCVATDHGTT